LQQLFVEQSIPAAAGGSPCRRLKKESPGGGEERVRRAYLLLYGRPATDRQFSSPRSSHTGKRCCVDAVPRRPLMSNEFLFVD
jgi:hypothetical protein